MPLTVPGLLVGTALLVKNVAVRCLVSASESPHFWRDAGGKYVFRGDGDDGAVERQGDEKLENLRLRGD